LRIEGAERVRLVSAALALPVIGIVKRDLPDCAVRITPWLQDVDALCRAGAAVVAVDATDRTRPVPVAALFDRIRAHGCRARADCATLAEGLAALDLGFADLEDAMQTAAAMLFGAQAIVTRNIRDYRHSPIKADTPESVLKLLE
jgi:putative N-acetylmannosamine-6-phosphate epimerase